MLRTNRQGFTLIELMVVIVIIGVLASLAIPRFTDASIKAKVAEAPRVIASFESAYLAGVAEGNVTAANLVFDAAPVTAQSKWFGYTVNGAVGPAPAKDDGLVATPKAQIGKIDVADKLDTKYDPGTDNFTHTAAASIQKYVPNF